MVEDAGVSALEAAGEAVLTREDVAPPAEGEVREFRLGLVCDGGVSLAIYMHGVTKEVHKLVQASVAFELEETANPFGPDDTARVYWDLLRSEKEATGFGLVSGPLLWLCGG